MDIEISLQTIKVTPPRLALFLDGPFLEALTDEQKETERQLHELVDNFNARMREIQKKEPDSYGWFFPDWMDFSMRIEYASSWENFKLHMTRLAAEHRALYLERERQKSLVIPKEISPESSEGTGPA